jgi:general secretion pathway protein G
MEVVKMVKSKHLRGTVAAWLLVLLSFAGGVRAEISPRSKGDSQLGETAAEGHRRHQRILRINQQEMIEDIELLKILPTESLFCVRVNNLDQTLSTVDQFLVGVSPTPMTVSMLVRGQLAKMLGSAELNGVNMGGSFVLFGVTSAGKPSGPKPSDMFIGALVPITDYKQFIDGNPNLSPPDANGVSKNTIGGMLIKKVGNYALIGPSESGTFAATAKLISVKSAKLGSVLDAAEVQQAMKEPLWVYGNIQQVSKSFGPLLSVQLEQMKKMMQSMETSKQVPMGPSVKIIDMYIAIFETLMNETKSLSLTVRPRPNACNLTVSVSAVPGTEMANMFAADTSSGKENRLMGYLEDGAMMNFACKMNTPFWKQLNLKSINLLTSIAGEAMTAEDITKIKTMTTDMISAIGGPVVFSFFIDANSKPPFVLKYVLEVKDADKFNKVFEEAMEMMNAGGGIADFYKSLGIEMGFTIKRGVGSYKGVSIDSAKLVMKSTDPNLPQGQMIDTMYGDGFEYRLAIVDGLCVFTVGGDTDSAIRKLIDEVKASGPKQMAAEMKAALTLLPEAGTADFMGMYNFLRLFKMMGAMAGAFMPVPMPVSQMDIPTKSNIVFAGKAGNNRMTVEICLPKEHLTEIIAAFQPPLAKARDQGKRAVSMNNLKQIALACLLYAEEHDGKFAPDLQQLYPYHRNPKLLESPRKPKDFDGPSYIYVAGLKMRMRDVSRIIIFYENPAFCSDGICVAFMDGHCEWMKPAEFMERLQATYKQLGRKMPEIKFKDSTKSTKQPTRTQHLGEAKRNMAKAKMSIIENALIRFYLDCGRYPDDSEGLQALLESPADVEEKWKGPYVKRSHLLDSWDNPYVYVSEGEVNPRSFDLISYGADGEEGGVGSNVDIYNK